MSVNFRLKVTNIIGQRKAFYRQRVPGCSCVRKETVDIDVWGHGAYGVFLEKHGRMMDF